MKRLLVLLPVLFAFALPTARAADAPTITISKSDRLTIALEGVSGEVAKTLQNDLTMSGYFKFVPADSAAYVVRAVSTGPSLAGKVADRGGNVVLNTTKNGTPRQQAHLLADDIIQTLTGAPGIAGGKIAFVANKTGSKEIYTVDSDGAGLVQLTRDNSISVGPHLRPDGRALVYTGYKSGYADVYQVDLSSGSRSRIIKFPGTNTGASYSPNGSRLAVTLSKDGNPELYVTSANGGNPRRLTHTRGVESAPTWSPDGDEIIYVNDDRGTPQLYRIPAIGGTGRLIATGHGYNTEPDWSPDGKKVAFNVRQGGAFAVAVLELATGQTRIVAEGQSPSWGANSRHLVFAQAGALILLDAQSGQRTTLISGLGSVTEPTWSR